MTTREKNAELIAFRAATITAFLEAAAEKGWHMRPDKTTEEMYQAGVNGMFSADELDPVEMIWRATCDAAPEFQWDK